MEFEYGKIAYLKALKLEKELEELKNSLTQKTSNNIFLVSENDDNNSTEYSKTITFNVIESGKYNFQGNVITEFDGQNQISVEMILNGEKIKSFEISSSFSFEYNFDTICQTGKNELIVVFLATNNFNLKKLNLNLTKYDSDELYHRLSKVDYLFATYVLEVNGDEAKLSRIEYNQNEFEELLTFKCKDAQLCGYCIGELRIAYIDENSNLLLKNVSIDGQTASQVNLDASGVTSLCSYVVGNDVHIYFSRFSQIYRCVYNGISENFYVEKTLKKGNVLFSEPDVSGVYIIADFTSNTKLVIE